MSNARRDRIDLIYKNLEYISNRYNATEQIFPLWEAAFSLIVGQLILAYFNPEYFNLCGPQKNGSQLGLIFIGCILTYIWFILVSLNLQHALDFDRQLKIIEDMLRRELDENCVQSLSPFRPFITPEGDISSKGKWTRWTLEDIMIGKRNDKGRCEALSDARRSTWLYRRALPLILFMIWVFLAGTINVGCAILIIVVSVAITLLLFDP